MRVVVQRVLSSSVSVDGKLVNKIGKGFNLLVGVNVLDTLDDVDYIYKKVINLRIFDDDNGVMNKSILDIPDASILSISQFTLQADTKKGNRPSYINAMKGEDALVLYQELNKRLNEHVNTYEGVFGADMKVEILNDGPVTIIIDSKDK